MSAGKESGVGWLIYGGIALIPIGCVITFILYFGGMMRLEASNYRDFTVLAFRAIGPLIVLAGFAMMAIGLFIGFRAEKHSRSGSGKVFVDTNVRVIARFGIDDYGEIIYEGWQFENYDHPKYLVKLQHSNGKVAEYYTRPEVWAHCGEGLLGEAMFDGGWLGRFQPRIGPPPSA
jgi:hypothetical protein